MTALFIITLLLLIAALVALFFSVRKNLQYSETFENAILQIEESLDILNVCHERVDLKSKLELFLDEPVVRELMDDITTSRDAIALVASKIHSSLNEEEINEEE